MPRRAAATRRPSQTQTPASGGRPSPPLRGAGDVANIAACKGEAGGEGREGDESNKLTSRKLGGGEQQSKWRRPPVEKL